MKRNVIPTPRATYDYSQLIDKAKKDSQYFNFPSFVAEKIREYRVKYCDGEVHHTFTRATLASIIGVELSTLTKILNGRKATKKRDIIIALCLALRLSESETNQALNLYSMAPLNQYNLRDVVIKQAFKDRLSVSELNDALKTHQFPQLNVNRSCERDKDRYCYYPLTSTAYEETSATILPYSVEGGDSDQSLHERYRPDRFDYHSEMIIHRKNEDMPIYRISLEEDNYTISKQEGSNNWEDLYSNEYFRQKLENIPPCEDPELLKEIAILKEYTDQRARYVHDMCGDTRNYGSRFDAINEQGRLVIYGEGFDYDDPELCEYFQIEISSAGCLFTVSNTSMFLKKYLGSEQWLKLYGFPLPPPLQSFTSIGDIADQRRLAQFQKLMNSAREFLADIQKRKLFLFNARAWIDIDDLMHIFKVEEVFDCVQPDESPYDIIPQKEQIIGLDGKPVTVNDLYRAAELDIYTLEDLCAIRTQYGTLEKFLDIEVLTEQKGN